MDAILVPGGFGERGIEGKIQAVRYARENSIPYLGICLGMQLAIIEYARHVLGPAGRAISTEFNRAAPHPVIALITEWQDAKGTARSSATRSPSKGGTMRLGAQEVRLVARLARAPDLRHGRDPRAPPPPLRVQQQLPAERCMQRGPALLRLLARRPGGDHRAADHPWFVASAVPPGVHARRRATAIRCSPASSRRRARTAQEQLPVAQSA